MYLDNTDLYDEDWRIRLQLELPWTTLHIRITPQGCSLAEKIGTGGFFFLLRMHVCVCGCTHTHTHIDGADKRDGGVLLTDPVPAPHFLLLLRRYGLMLTPGPQ